MAKNKGNKYKNINGEMTIEEMIKIKHDNKIEDFMRSFSLLKNKCPNSKLKPKNGSCFYCIECLTYAFDEIKEFKTCYKIGKYKYLKEEIDGNKKC